MQQIYKRTHMPKRDFDKVAKAWVFTLNLLHILRAPFSKNISGWLLPNTATAFYLYGTP